MSYTTFSGMGADALDDCSELQGAPLCGSCRQLDFLTVVRALHDLGLHTAAVSATTGPYDPDVQQAVEAFLQQQGAGVVGVERTQKGGLIDIARLKRNPSFCTALLAAWRAIPPHLAAPLRFATRPVAVPKASFTDGWKPPPLVPGGGGAPDPAALDPALYSEVLDTTAPTDTTATSWWGALPMWQKAALIGGVAVGGYFVVRAVRKPYRSNKRRRRSRFVALDPKTGLVLRDATTTERRYYLLQRARHAAFRRPVRVGAVFIDEHHGPGIWHGGAGF